MAVVEQISLLLLYRNVVDIASVLWPVIARRRGHLMLIVPASFSVLTVGQCCKRVGTLLTLETVSTYPIMSISLCFALYCVFYFIVL